MSYKVVSIITTTHAAHRYHGDKEDCKHNILLGGGESAEDRASGWHELLGQQCPSHLSGGAVPTPVSGLTSPQQDSEPPFPGTHE